MFKVDEGGICDFDCKSFSSLVEAQLVLNIL